MRFALEHKLNVRYLPVKGTIVSFQATDAQCIALASNHDLLSVDSFSVYYHFYPWKHKAIKMRGNFSASIVQKCVITLLPIEKEIKENLDLLFVPSGSKFVTNHSDYIDSHGELFLDIDGPDAPEIYENNTIDVGAITEEFFELALDPYPRYDNVTFHYETDEKMKTEKVIEQNNSPFSVLQKLK